MTKDKKIKNVLEKYEIYQLLEFGPKLRHELVEKWILLGRQENYTDPNELFIKFDEFEKQIESIIGRNYVPAYPFYILTMLQALEGNIRQKQDYSLHGFYYEHLINQKLYESIKVKEDISLYINYITELAFYLFERKVKYLSIRDFLEFHKLYSEKYQINYSSEKILRSLESAKLIELNGLVHIRYKYIYYFFVAKYLTNNLAKPEIRELITKMCKRVYREEYANIIMFLTHLSKDPFIIKEILDNSRKIFSEAPIAKLEKDIAGINELIKDVPKQVLENVNAKDKREENLEEREEIEMLEKEFDEIEDEEFDLDLDEEVDGINYIAKMVLATKTIDILGQLAKKYWGGMTGEEKYDVASEAFFLGLRTLSSYVLLIQENKEGVIDAVTELIKKSTKKNFQDKYLTRQEAEEASLQFVFRLCFLATYGTIKRVSNAIGFEKLSPTFKAIETNEPVNSVKLINLSIKLDYCSDSIPYNQIEGIKTLLEGNNIGNLVLKNLLIDYMYMFNLGLKDKQRVCSLLGIEMQEQRTINATSVTKKQ